MQNFCQKQNGLIPATSHLLVFFRIGFGLVFVFSGSIKITSLAGFSEALSNFGIIPEQLISLAAILIPVTEIIIGAAILLGLRTALMSQFAVAMLVMFTAVIAAKLSEGAQVNCACFGPLGSEKISETTILRNIILLLWGVLLVALYSSRHSNKQAAGNSPNRKNNAERASLATALTISLKPDFWKNLQRMIWFVVILFLAIELVLLSKQNRELKSRLAMLVGNRDFESLKPGDVVPPFKATDLEDKEIEITYDGAATKTLLLTFSTACRACERNLPNWSDIVSKLERSPFQVVGISLNPADVTQKYVLENGVSYPVFVPSDITFVRNYKPFLTPQAILIDVQRRVEQLWTGVLDSQQKEEILAMLEGFVAQ